nr:MAG TPA: hypothetical protein [Caudoviricetes sp.]
MVAPLLLSIQHLPQMPLLFCLLAHTLTRAVNVPRETLELS